MALLKMAPFAILFEEVVLLGPFHVAKWELIKEGLFRTSLYFNIDLGIANIKKMISATFREKS